MKVTAELVEAFAGTFLSPLYDQPKPTPDLHREAWNLYCSNSPRAALAAPRNHAKSTALTHDYTLAIVLFREENYIIILGSSEEMAIEHLNDISVELHENEDLKREFKIKQFITDAKTEIIVECDDGYQFRIIARGAEQKIRGRKWKGKRPGMVIADDMEDDEQVENRDRRKKFKRWFLRAAKQALRDGGKIRAHGTILHEDSMLANLIKIWAPNSRCYRAHASFGDFSNILWPEKFPESRLRDIRQEFIDAGDASGYSQEYLNDPLDNTDAFYRKEQFLPMDEEDRRMPKQICAGADFAVSKEDAANRTSFNVAGKCPRNLIHFLDYRVGRWDTLEWIEEMFSIQLAWKPEFFFVEDGVIWKAIRRMVYNEMQERDLWINIVEVPSTKDKGIRARPMQKKMKARGCRFDKEHSAYDDFEAELLRFTGLAQATLDDQTDSAGLIVRGFDLVGPGVEKEDFMDEDEIESEAYYQQQKFTGRNAVTGY